MRLVTFNLAEVCGHIWMVYDNFLIKLMSIIIKLCRTMRRDKQKDNLNIILLNVFFT